MRRRRRVPRPAGRDTAKPMAPSTGMKTTQSEQKEPAAAKNQRAEENVQGPKAKGASAENDNNAKAGKEMRAEDRNGKSDMKAEGAQNKGAAENNSVTTGQAGAGGKLSSEQRTKITSVIREQHVAPVTNINFSISVGTQVPRDVSFHALPAEIVTFYPEWRGYEYFLVNDRIVVVDPRTFEIVAVLDV